MIQIVIVWMTSNVGGLQNFIRLVLVNIQMSKRIQSVRLVIIWSNVNYAIYVVRKLCQLAIHAPTGECTKTGLTENIIKNVGYLCCDLQPMSLEGLRQIRRNSLLQCRHVVSTVHTCCDAYQRVPDTLQNVFEWYKAANGILARQTCPDCGEMLTNDNWTMKSVGKKGKQYYLNRCKPCIVEADSILRTLKKRHPQPQAGTPCACCGRIDKLFCDHDHSTKEFRGYCCRTCNSAIGMLGDSEAGLRLAIEYLERARLKSRSRSPSNNKTKDTDQNDELAFSRGNNFEQRAEDVPIVKWS